MLDHRLGDGNLGSTIGSCTLGVGDDPDFVVDEIVGVVSEKGISVLPCNPCRLRIGQRDLFRRLASIAAAIRTTVIGAGLLVMVGGIERCEVLANRARRPRLREVCAG